MEDFEVIEYARNSEKIEILKAISYKEPTYIRIESEKKFTVGTILQSDGKEVFEAGAKTGVVSETKSSNGISISTDYDIKYTGGYSKDGKVIYIARTLPKEIEIKGKKLSLINSIGLHHELVEKWLVDDLYQYPYAHEVATKIEKQYVESLGIEWHDYDEAVGKLLHENYEKKLEKSPKDLDLSPYMASNDTAAIKEIRDSVEP
ncbi:hypothetical protein Micr_00731 [Candidatus Micrarchaeum sp.]|jgi:hypothetical protein|uniref:hypothetical protein n=1 Tax=Candidatus Micrarchaeum sp. TaxID=2282148 RepID=UPI000928BD4D|nr:hypothetical protein [Candidatus Micrarchaeum sp.]OJI06659.1 MAG: hypothetical protein BK997_05470 [Candidatus Micrarchaeum sp. ARMAN-1]OJT94705.1 MAG: hypothetical protein JJ59_01285 [Candidatus Micrarchaeum sp. AZ1]OWP53742.1 MAG: hypothetical protein B2I19_02230 [Thermoplasmatales archaeon ARMAN]QRF74198.1 hypothetical protein Micr_00731 [Candidatus Micrarchaeum sp.]